MSGILLSLTSPLFFLNVVLHLQMLDAISPPGVLCRFLPLFVCLLDTDRSPCHPIGGSCCQSPLPHLSFGRGILEDGGESLVRGGGQIAAE